MWVSSREQARSWAVQWGLVADGEPGLVAILSNGVGEFLRPLWPPSRPVCGQRLARLAGRAPSGLSCLEEFTGHTGGED